VKVKKGNSKEIQDNVSHAFCAGAALGVQATVRFSVKMRTR
jgi:hypothetical protein